MDKLWWDSHPYTTSEQRTTIKNYSNHTEQDGNDKKQDTEVQENNFVKENRKNKTKGLYTNVWFCSSKIRIYCGLLRESVLYTRYSFGLIPSFTNVETEVQDPAAFQSWGSDIWGD